MGKPWRKLEILECSRRGDAPQRRKKDEYKKVRKVRELDRTTLKCANNLNTSLLGLPLPSTSRCTLSFRCRVCLLIFIKHSSNSNSSTMRFSAFIAGALTVALAAAHPGEEEHIKEKERLARRSFLENIEKRDLSHCASKLKERGIQARNVQRRAEKASALRRELGIPEHFRTFIHDPVPVDCGFKKKKC